MTRELIFKGADLDVFYYKAAGSQALFVTFTNFGGVVPRLGFAEEFVEKQGYSGLYFIQKANHWWQTPEVFEAIAAIKATGLLRAHPKKIGYGSSMGGYGAILFSAHLDLDQVIALSPQYSIQRSKVAFDPRWKRESEEINFICDDLSIAVKHGDVHVFYDPFHQDSKHVKLISKEVPCKLYRVPFAGHPVVRLIAEAGLLKSTVLGLVDGSFSKLEFSRALRAGRRQHKQFFFGMARAAYHSNRMNLVIRISDIGLKLDANYLKLLRFRALAQLKLGDLDEAYLSACRCIEAEPKNKLSTSLLDAVRLAKERRAREVASLARNPGSPPPTRDSAGGLDSN